MAPHSPYVLAFDHRLCWSETLGVKTPSNNQDMEKIKINSLCVKSTSLDVFYGLQRTNNEHPDKS